MPVCVAVLVGPADLRVRKGSGLLTCVGLRTGACLCLYDPITHVAGMAHVTHSDLEELSPTRPGKYVASSLEGLTVAMERAGAVRSRLRAAIVGGAEVSVHSADNRDDALVVESGICRALELELMRMGLNIYGAEIGGSADRSVVLEAASGNVRIRAAGEDRILCNLRYFASHAAAA